MKIKVKLTAETRDLLQGTRADLVERLAQYERIIKDHERAVEESAQWDQAYHDKMTTVNLQDDADIDVLLRLNIRRQLAPAKALQAEKEATIARGSVVLWMKGVQKSVSVALTPTYNALVDAAESQLAALFATPSEARQQAFQTEPVCLLEAYIASSYQTRNLEFTIRLCDEILSGEIEIGGAAANPITKAAATSKN